MLPTRVAYWVQRADYSATNYPPVPFRRAWKALRRHDWRAERDHWQQLAEQEQETCMPGIGFVHDQGYVLHFCPSGFGGGACYLLDGDQILELSYVDADQQRRLLRLLYGGRREKLAQLFANNLTEPPWRAMLRELYPSAKMITAVAAGFVLLLTLLFFAIDLANGRPLRAALAHSLETLPFLLWVHALMIAGLLPLIGLFALTIAFLHRRGWTFEIEGRDYTTHVALCGVLIVFMAALSAWTGKWDNYPYFVGYAVSFCGMFIWPLVIMSGLRRQQDRLLDAIRADYILATTELMQGADNAAQGMLARIRKTEAQWRMGAHPVIRFAHVAWAGLTNLFIAVPGQVFHYHLNSYQNPSSLTDTLRFMFETPSVFAITFGVALFFSLFMLPDAMRVQGRNWSDFYGDRLEAALKAGRGVERAEHHDAPPLPEDVTARELLGLNSGFTKAQLRAAWLRLARELHPDRWSSAGPAVRKMKEAALKRVNAARDELAPQAL